MFPNIKTTLAGYANYKGYGLLAFLLHRITGLGTLFFLTIHVLTTSSVYFYPQGYNKIIGIFRWPPVMFAEIILVFCVIYHGVNGLRIAYLDLFKPDLWKKASAKKSVIYTLMIAIVLWIPPAAVMGYNMFHFGLSLFGKVEFFP